MVVGFAMVPIFIGCILQHRRHVAASQQELAQRRREHLAAGGGVDQPAVVVGRNQTEGNDSNEQQ